MEDWINFLKDPEINLEYFLKEINAINPGYDYKFKSKEIAKYFIENCVDLTIDREDCKSKGLPYADEKGNLRNVDKFREAALFYQEHRKYQLAPYRSEQMIKFWDAEKEKCKYGVKLGQIRITGRFYFFLNFFSMIIADEKGEEARTLPNFWFVHFNFSHLLDYCYEKRLNLSLIKPRSVGLSEFAAACGVYDFFIVHLDSFGEPQFRSNRYFANDKKYLKGEDGIFLKMTKAIQWLNKRGENKMKKYTTHTRDNSEMLWVAGYREKDNNQEQTGGSIKCTILTSPDDARGGRISIGWWEESGANPKLGESLQVGRSLTRRGEVKTGIHIIWGTSNADKSGIEAFEKILTKPRAYEGVEFEDVWKGIDKVKEKHKVKDVPKYCFEYMLPEDTEEKGVGWFIPYYDVKGMDSDGNPDRELMFDKIMEERYKSMSDSGTDKNVLLWIADHPVTLQEALFKGGGSMFATDKLAKRYQDLTVHKTLPIPKVGDLEWKKSPTGEIIGVEFNENSKGKVHILEEPIKSPSGEYFKNLYIGGIDSIDQGTDESQGKTGSDFGMLIKKRTFGTRGNVYVAYYLDRPKLSEEAYENAAKLLWYYQCKANLEFTKIRILSTFRNNGWLRFLYPRPRIANTDIVKDERGRSHKYGTPAHDKYILHGLELITTYVHTYVDNIYIPELAKQLLEYEYENKGKFDLIAAMQMCEIADEDMSPLNIKNSEKKEVFKIGYYVDDSGSKRYGKIPKSNLTINFAENKPQISYIDEEEKRVVYQKEFDNHVESMNVR